MAILGIKVTPSIIWYAILVGDKANPQVRNINDEHRIPFPNSAKTQQEKAAFLFNEIIRILDRNKDIHCISIKESEFVGPHRETEAKRFSNNLDGVIMAVACYKQINFVKKLLASLGTKKANVLDVAEAISGKTKTYWVNDVAEAILAGKSAL